MIKDFIKKCSVPKIPVYALLAEAERLITRCDKDSAILIGTGLQWKKYDQLVSARLCLQKAETEWLMYQESYRVKKAEYRKFLHECKKYRDSFRDQLCLAFKMTGVDKTIPGMSRKNGCPDIIQHLSDLAFYSESISGSHRQQLSSMASKCQELANELAYRNAQITNDNPIYSEESKIRKKAICQLYFTMTEIMDIGKFAFVKDLLHRKAYAFRYFSS